MISKENFVKYMEKYEKLLDRRHELYKLGIELDILDDFDNLLYDILVDIFKDDDWISYFCFDLCFGNNYKDGMITTKSGINISMKNARELYDVLINNMK